MEDLTTDGLVGVCIAWCDNGELKKQWVDLKKVSALAWGTGVVKERKEPKYGNDKLPSTKEPLDCPQVKALGGAPVCWWNGQTWVCGET